MMEEDIDFRLESGYLVVVRMDDRKVFYFVDYEPKPVAVTELTDFEGYLINKVRSNKKALDSCKSFIRDIADFGGFKGAAANMLLAEIEAAVSQ